MPEPDKRVHGWTMDTKHKTQRMSHNNEKEKQRRSKKKRVWIFPLFPISVNGTCESSHSTLYTTHFEVHGENKPWT